MDERTPKQQKEHILPRILRWVLPKRPSADAAWDGTWSSAEAAKPQQPEPAQPGIINPAAETPEQRRAKMHVVPPPRFAPPSVFPRADADQQRRQK